MILELGGNWPFVLAFKVIEIQFEVWFQTSLKTETKLESWKKNWFWFQMGRGLRRFEPIEERGESIQPFNCHSAFTFRLTTITSFLDGFNINIILNYPAPLNIILIVCNFFFIFRIKFFFSFLWGRHYTNLCISSFDISLDF